MTPLSDLADQNNYEWCCILQSDKFSHTFSHTDFIFGRRLCSKFYFLWTFNGCFWSESLKTLKLFKISKNFRIPKYYTRFSWVEKSHKITINHRNFGMIITIDLISCNKRRQPSHCSSSLAYCGKLIATRKTEHECY